MSLPHDGAPAPSLETNVRLFLAAITAGAMGIGYVYTHPGHAPAADSRTGTNRPLFDWQSADDTLNVVSSDVGTSADEPPLVVRDTITRTRSEIASALDDFVRTNTEENSKPVPSDIVSQTEGPGGIAQDPELVPFATSEQQPSLDPIETGPTDIASDSANRNKSSTPDSNPASDNSSAADATSPTKIQDPQSDLSRAARSADATSKPRRAGTQSQTTGAPVGRDQDSLQKGRTELLPGNVTGKTDQIDKDWKVIGKSSNGILMHSRKFGRQGNRTFIIAGLDGQDLAGARWNDELSMALERRTELYQSNEVLLVRAGNPDGLVKQTEANARGVLINRNFPSRRYQFLTDKTAGPGPASEPETHAIMESLYSFRPRRIIHLASTSGRSTVIYNRAAKDLAVQLQKQFGLNAQQLDVEFAPGSIEDFADGTLDAAVISLKLNPGSDWQASWQKHLPTVMAAIGGQIQMNAGLTDTSRSSSDQLGTQIPNTDEEVELVKKPRRGYEELPPPRK